MWSYYGSKSKIIHYYPPPKYGKIIEPFAGTARYALKYFDREVIINDKYEVVYRIWKWLQLCSKADILGLPEPKKGETINRDDFDCIEQAWLMGFFVNAAPATPRLTVTAHSGSIPFQKKQVANQLFKIKHWLITNNDYSEIDNTDATWFIDPPYQNGGHEYRHSNKHISFSDLAVWCKSREGQVIVCENTKADWLPFVPVVNISGQYQKTTEALWTNRPTSFLPKPAELFNQGGNDERSVARKD